MRHVCPLAAMAVAGHHAGLPDLGSYGELEGSTFMSRMNRHAGRGIAIHSLWLKRERRNWIFRSRRSCMGLDPRSR